MSATMDRRIADRRRTVVEHGARRRLRRMLILLVLVGLGGFTGWLLYHSPFLAVSEIGIEGWSESRAAEIVAGEGIAEGVPTINVRPAKLEAALIEDPWIAAASVTVTWPGSVAVAVLERDPAGWVEAGEVWLLTDASGVVLEAATAPHDGPTVSVGTTATVPGGEVDGAAGAALEFLQALPGDLAAGASIEGSVDELRGVVAGRSVLLGYPTDMAAKAAAVVALLEAGVSDGAEINVVSPERPAVNSQLEVESLGEVIGEPDSAG